MNARRFSSRPIVTSEDAMWRDMTDLCEMLGIAQARGFWIAEERITKQIADLKAKIDAWRAANT